MGVKGWLALSCVALVSIPAAAQTTCRTHADCPCGQFCALDGTCADVAAPACTGDRECPRDALFSGRCVDFTCQLACRDDASTLQRAIDAAPKGSTVTFPSGSFRLSAPLMVGKSLRIVGAGTKRNRKPRRPQTTLVVENPEAAAFTIQPGLANIRVSFAKLDIVSGGIVIGSEFGECLDGGDPVDRFVADVDLKDMTIEAGAREGVRFEGGSLTIIDVDLLEHLCHGLYVANATGPIVVVDTNLVDNLDCWGAFICAAKGSGLVFFNDVNASHNGRGGIAIVGRGEPPDFRPVCIQNTSAAFNLRFGVLLYEVASTLLFNVGAGFTFSDANGHFGDGFSIATSEQVFLWDVTSTLNNRAGFAAFELFPNESTHVHIVGDFSALNNAINLNEDGGADLDPHEFPVTFAACGGVFTAPPADARCEEGFGEVPCKVLSASLEPPSPLP